VKGNGISEMIFFSQIFAELSTGFADFVHVLLCRSLRIHQCNFAKAFLAGQKILTARI